jgi:hypothetical protein
MMMKSSLLNKNVTDDDDVDDDVDDDENDFKVVKSKSKKKKNPRRALPTMATHSLAHIRNDAASQFDEIDIFNDLNRLVSLYAAAACVRHTCAMRCCNLIRVLLFALVLAVSLCRPKRVLKWLAFVALARAAAFCAERG